MTEVGSDWDATVETRNIANASRAGVTRNGCFLTAADKDDRF